MNQLLERCNVYSSISIINYYKNRKISIKKALGQNFLIDNLVCKQITDLVHGLLISLGNSSKDELHVLEIGPGLGGITNLLCSELYNFKKVYIVEKDKDFHEILSFLHNQFPEKLDLFFIDFKFFNIDQLSKLDIITGNLPYNCATNIITTFIQQSNFYPMVFTLQLEVARRICAPVSARDYGYLSVLCQCFFECCIHINIESEKFFPKPKVMSAVISMIPKKQIISLSEYQTLKGVLNCVFSHRRKQIGKTLARFNVKTASILDEIGIDKTLRPQDISVEQYVQLAKKFISTH